MTVTETLPINDMGLKIQAYNLACQEFGEYLDGKRKGRSDSKKAPKRVKEVEESCNIYGDESLLGKFQYEYIKGYQVVVQTMSVLRRNHINKVSQLVDIDIDNSTRHMPGFGFGVADVVKHLQKIVKAERDFKSNFS